jgi:hypothetical protein
VPAQTQKTSEPYKKWLDCRADWFSTEADATVGPDFSLNVSYHGTPVAGARIDLNKTWNASGDGIAATAKTDSRGIVTFRAIPEGSYFPSSPDGLLFPLYQIIRVKAGQASGKSVTLHWPDHSIVVRNLRGRFSFSEEPDDPELPLRAADVELWDIYTSRLIESAHTDANGDFELATKDPGIYAVRLLLPKKNGEDVEKRDLAVEIDPAAKVFSFPELRVTRCHCPAFNCSER